MSSQAFCVIDDARLVEMISASTEQVAYVAPGVSEEVAVALVDAVRRLPEGRVSLVLDADPEICRMGYGTAGGLRRLRDEAKANGVLVGSQTGLRIGVLVSDSRLVVYSPTPLLLEERPASADSPNALELSLPPLPNKRGEPQAPPSLGSGVETAPDADGAAPAEPNDREADALGSLGRVLRNLGLGPDGDGEREIGLDPVTEETLHSVEEDLKKVPPVEFDLARRLRVYSAHIQFVELNLKGCNLSRKTFRIPSDLMPLAPKGELESRVHARVDLAFRSAETVEVGGRSLSEDLLTKRKKEIFDDYMVSLRNYGWVVRKDRKPELDSAVKELVELVEQFSEAVKVELQRHLDQLLGELVDLLLPGAMEHPPARYTKTMGTRPSEAQVRQALAHDLRRRLPSAETLASDMEVRRVYKDVTFESLNDEEFLRLAQDAMPTLAELHSETQAAGERRQA